MNEEKLLEFVRDKIVRRFAPLRIILFGSRATGHGRPNSDLDLLVVMPKVADKRRTAIEMRHALSDLPVGKDVFVTTPEEIAESGDLVGSIVRPALREGRTIYERN